MRGADRPTVDEIRVGDEPDDWRAAGFTVDDDGICRLGTVRLAFVGKGEGRGILGWSLRDTTVTGPIDGVPTTASDRHPAEPAEHACGATHLDHIVLMSPDGARTATAVSEATGLEVRRVRDTDTYGTPMRQRFFRFGEVILELVSTEPPGEGTAAFFGLAITVRDLDALPARYGEGLGAIKEAVQPGRRVAALRHRNLHLSVPTILMTPDP